MFPEIFIFEFLSFLQFCDQGITDPTLRPTVPLIG